MTSCQKALQTWQDREGANPEEAETVKLLCLTPPITKMDGSLNNLVNVSATESHDHFRRVFPRKLQEQDCNVPIPRPRDPQCQKLSLSTNSIEKMIPLPGLKNLKILSLGRNQIKKIGGKSTRVLCCVQYLTTCQRARRRCVNAS